MFKYERGWQFTKGGKVPDRRIGPLSCCIVVEFRSESVAIGKKKRFRHETEASGVSQRPRSFYVLMLMKL